jgi:hypothetical protein
MNNFSHLYSVFVINRTMRLVVVSSVAWRLCTASDWTITSLQFAGEPRLEEFEQPLERDE